MNRAKPKILKNLNSLYSVFMPSKSSTKKPSTGNLNYSTKKMDDYVNP
jgi:hypothetical protein